MLAEDIFTPELLAVGYDKIVDTIAEVGVFTFQNALQPTAIDRILEQVSPMDFSLNVNHVAPVLTQSQVFLTNFMARSKTAYDVVTSDLTLHVCDRLMKKYAIAGKRIYTTKSSMHMQWHCDVEAICRDPYDVDATVFIFYLTDVKDGEWQYVAGSHTLGENFVGGADMDKVIEQKFGPQIRSVTGPRGTMVIYNGRTFHRAKPMKVGSPPRTSLFYQINKGITAGEPMVVDLGFLDNLDERRKMLLGIGRPSVMPIFPRTAMKSLATEDLERLGLHVKKALSQRQEQTLTPMLTGS